MSIIDSDLTSIAFCWRVERRDGITIGFTTHDRDLEIGELLYRAAPGMLPSALTLSDGFDADSLDIKGALTSNAITEADLKAGRWDGAAVSIFMADWERPGEEVALVQGVLGDVAVEGEGFSAEMRGLTQMLERPVCEQTSPECRAELGDKGCRVDMAGRVRVTSIIALVGEEMVEVADASSVADAYAYGRLRWIAGANSGLETMLVASAGNRLTLQDPPRFPATVGDVVEIREGCNKSLEACSSRFANAINFRGEPHLPGMDLLTRYPGA